MRVFNYSNYAKTIEIGVSNPNMTKIATALFKSIIDKPFVLNQAGNPYYIDSKQAKAWYDQTKDIPGNIKNAAGKNEVINTIGDYFSNEIIDNLINPMLEAAMYSDMLNLIHDSDLQQTNRTELLGYYQDGDNAEFLGRAFLYAVVGNN